MFLLTVEDATGSTAYEMIYKLFKTYDAALLGALKVGREFAIDQGEQDTVDALDSMEKRVVMAVGEIDTDELSEVLEENLEMYFNIHEVEVEVEG